jgi:hypothetical protein
VQQADHRLAGTTATTQDTIDHNDSQSASASTTTLRWAPDNFYQSLTWTLGSSLTENGPGTMVNGTQNRRSAS